MTGAKAQRGFSLIELTVATAISLIVVAAGVALLISTQRMFQKGSDDRAMQETARVAIDEVSTRLRMAGYGLEPTFTFDLGQADTVMDRVPPGSAVRFGGYGCATPVTCRDSIDAPDELVFYARDPDFGMDLTPIGSGTAKLVLSNPSAGTSAVRLRAGQILQVMCYGTGNQWLWAYVTVKQNVDSTAAAVDVELLPQGSATLDFPSQNNLLGNACFQGGLRRVFKIDRYRYFVAAVDAAGNLQPWETPGTRPYLMLDQGLADADGNVTPVAIAPDVEDVQVSYVFPLSAADAQVVGAAEGTAVAASEAGIDLAPALGIPSYTTPTLDPRRTTHHPANVKAVRVAFTIRSPRSDPGVFDDKVPAVANRAEVDGEAGFRRMVFETTTRVRNMDNRLPLFPVYFSDSGFTGANIGGG